MEPFGTTEAVALSPGQKKLVKPRARRMGVVTQREAARGATRLAT